MNAKAVWRPTMTSDVVFELVDLLESTKRTTGLSQNLRGFLSKLDSLAYDIGKGNRTPAYVATGAKEAKAISLENLGATADEFKGTNAGIVTPDMLANSSSSSPIPAKPKADLDDEEARLLEELDRQMREEMAANGAGSENVILAERRKVPRTPEAVVDISQL